MSEFDPVGILRALSARDVEFVVVGGVAARLRGAPLLTQDLDITPATGEENLERLARALEDLSARLRVSSEPEGIPFPSDSELLKTKSVWTLTTPIGDLDLVVAPAGTDGYRDIIRDADGLVVAVNPELTVMVASLLDVIRSKQAAGRAKDLAALPLLRQTLDALDLDP